MRFLADDDDNDYDEAISNCSCDQYGELWTWCVYCYELFDKWISSNNENGNDIPNKYMIMHWYGKAINNQRFLTRIK